MKDNVEWKSTVRCEPQTLSDLQENTEVIKKVKEELRDLRIDIWKILLGSIFIIGIFGCIFLFWALPVFIRLVNHLLSSN